MIIALEGIDNAGKTTITQILVDKLIEMGKSVTVSKELTTNVGNLIKSSIKNEGLSPISKSFLFASDRQIRIEDLSVNKKFDDIVIFDRYLHSAIVYREAEGIDGEWIKELNKNVPPSDIAFYIDITADESIKRNTDKKFNIHYTPEYLDKVRQAYLKYVDLGELIKIDGMKNLHNVADDIIKVLINKGVI